MQNKGLVKLFALLFGLVSIYQLSFTFKANQIENEAKQVAKAKHPDDGDASNIAELRYLDSLKTTRNRVGDELQPIEVYNLGIAKFTYSEVENNAMNLGLDLKGGINALSLIHISEPTRLLSISYAVFCLKKKK